MTQPNEQLIETIKQACSILYQYNKVCVCKILNADVDPNTKER
jgi:hypothetical protein